MGERIVIIEDDAAIADSMKIMLEMAGYKVTWLKELATVEELIDINPDCFILDENLPVVSGHIICILLRSKPATRNTPIILVSADPSLERYAALGEPNVSLKKPFDMTVFLNCVHSVLN